MHSSQTVLCQRALKESPPSLMQPAIFSQEKKVEALGTSVSVNIMTASHTAHRILNLSFPICVYYVYFTYRAPSQSNHKQRHIFCKTLGVWDAWCNMSHFRKSSVNLGISFLFLCHSLIPTNWKKDTAYTWASACCCCPHTLCFQRMFWQRWCFYACFRWLLTVVLTLWLCFKCHLIAKTGWTIADEKNQAR